MTAEIAVYNKTAVALAADSAVTISGGDTYKINNGAEKLFSLSKHHPVGIMVYGAGALCSVPWEIIIKAYRSKLGDKCFNKIDDYADDFWDFLCKATNIISEDMRNAHLEQSFSNVFLSLMDYVKKNHIQPTLQQNETVSADETCEFVVMSCERCVENFDNCEFFHGFDESTLEKALEFAASYSDRLFSEHFSDDDTECYRERIAQALSHVFALSICKVSPFGRNSGLVIAGYGDEQFFPSVLAYDVYGFFDGKIMLNHNKEKSSYDGGSGVTAYAQEDEVNAFMHGISSDLAMYIKGNIESIPDAACQHIKDVILEEISLPNGKDEVLLEKIRDLLYGYSVVCIEQVEKAISEGFTSKVIEMIEFLPKPDLGYMAESLVNLTAFKRKVSNDNETVGGPIDVAIISKGDGFVWVKRKHYFDKCLNHDYFSRR